MQAPALASTAVQAQQQQQQQQQPPTRLFSSSMGADEEEHDAAARAKIDELVKGNKIVLFMKGTR